MPAGSTVYLYTQSTTDATTTVPDATGKTGTFAAQMLKASASMWQFRAVHRTVLSARILMLGVWCLRHSRYPDHGT